MKYSNKKFSKFGKDHFYPNNDVKIHQKIYSNKEINLKSIFPYERNTENDFSHLHFPSQLYDNYFREPYSTIENNYSNYNNYNIRTNPIELHKDIHQKNISSYSRGINYNNIENINRKASIPTPKDSFRKSDIYPNEYNIDNYYYDRGQNNIYYNDFIRNKDLKTPKLFSYRLNSDINDYHSHNNYDYFNNNSFFTSLNNNNKRSNYNHYIINTNINYNYINNAPYYNSSNKDCNSKSKYNYNTDPNTIHNSKDFKLDIDINDEIFKLSDSEFERFLNMVYNLDNIDDIRYLNSKDIKNKIRSEEKYQLKSKSIKNFLKDEGSFKDLNLNKRSTFSKSVKYNNSYNELKFKKKYIFKKKDDSFENNENKKLNLFEQRRERKNKIKIESNNKENYINKSLFTYSKRSNINSRDSSIVNKSDIKEPKKYNNITNITIIKKDNNILRKKYNVNNNNYMLPKTTRDKKDIINSRKNKNSNLSIPIGRNTNKSLISSKIRNISTNLKSAGGMNKLLDDKIIKEKEKEKKQNITNKFKILNTNKIFNKNPIIINRRNNNNNKLIKNKIKIILKNAPTIKRVLNNRKHKCKIVLSEMVKKECDICFKLIETHLFKIHYNSHPTRILSWLYLGTFSNACDIEELRRNKINYVLNCAQECNNTKLPPDIKEYHLNVRDVEDFNIIEYFEEANDFINKCRLSGGNILVHCKFGISRSPTFIIAYLYKYDNYSIDEALKFVSQKRNKIKPNKGFMNQLYQYEEFFGKRIF